MSRKTDDEAAKYGALKNKLNEWREVKRIKSQIGNVSGPKKPLSTIDTNHLPQPTTGLEKKRQPVPDKTAKKKIVPDKRSSHVPGAAGNPTKQEKVTKERSGAEKVKEAAKAAELKNKLAEWKKKKEEEKEKQKQIRRPAFVPSSSKVKSSPAKAGQQLQKSQTLANLAQAVKTTTLKRRETFCIGKEPKNVPFARSKSTNVGSQVSRQKATNPSKTSGERRFITQAPIHNNRRISMPANKTKTTNVSAKPWARIITESTEINQRSSPRLKPPVSKPKPSVDRGFITQDPINDKRRMSMPANRTKPTVAASTPGPTTAADALTATRSFSPILNPNSRKPKISEKSLKAQNSISDRRRVSMPAHRTKPTLISSTPRALAAAEVSTSRRFSPRLNTNLGKSKPLEKPIKVQSSVNDRRRASMPASKLKPSDISSQPKGRVSNAATTATRRLSQKPNPTLMKSKPAKREPAGVFLRDPVPKPGQKQRLSLAPARVNHRPAPTTSHTPGRQRVYTAPSPGPQRNATKPKQEKTPQRQPVSRKQKPAVNTPKPMRSASVANLSEKVGTDKSNRRRSHSENDLRSTPKKKAPRKSILKTPHKENIEGEAAPCTTPHVRGAGVRFDIASTQGIPSATPGTASKRKSVGLTPLMARREALNAWLISKGKSPSRFSHLCCFDGNLPEQRENVAPIAGLDARELAHQQNILCDETRTSAEPGGEEEASQESSNAAYIEDTTESSCPLAEVTDHNYHSRPVPDTMEQELTKMLEECTELFESGCPGPSVLGWLDDIAKYFSGATSTAAYWICRANVVDQMEQDDRLTASVYEQAYKHNAEPSEDLAAALNDFAERMVERNLAKKKASKSPSRRRSGMEESNIFESSAVKYCVTNSTPFFKKLHKYIDDQRNVQAIVTPVRRSTRRSGANLPVMLHDHDVIIDHLEEVPLEAREHILYVANDAIEKEDVMDKENQQPLSRNLSQEFQEVEDEC